MKISADATNPTTSVANDPERLGWLNEAIRSYGEAHPEVSVIDLFGSVCTNGYTEQVDGITLRDDGLHLNEQGAALVWQRIAPAMIAAAS
jgi:lysophospholipase L1-like esterase